MTHVMLLNVIFQLPVTYLAVKSLPRLRELAPLENPVRVAEHQLDGLRCLLLP